MEVYKNISLEDLPGEEWRDVVGFEGFYKVSSIGRIKAIHGKEKIIKTSLDRRGYPRTTLCIRGRKKYDSIHRFVAIAFIDNPENKRTVNHKDGNKLNNCVDNLEWATDKENKAHAMANGLAVMPEHKMSGDHVGSKIVLQYDLNMNILREYSCGADAAREHNYTPEGIYNCCRGVFKSYKGFIWKYKQL